MFETMDPVHLAGFAAQCVVPTALSKFTPESIHLLKSYASHRDTREKTDRSSLFIAIIGALLMNGVCA